VVTLVVTLYAAVVGPYRNFKTTCLAMYAVVTPILIQITNTILSLTDEERAALPGANSSETRPNMVAASLIIVMVGAREATGQSERSGMWRVFCRCCADSHAARVCHPPTLLLSCPFPSPQTRLQIGNFQQMLFSAFTDNQTPSANQVGADSNIKV
jgi:hypothetical protein